MRALRVIVVLAPLLCWCSSAHAVNQISTFTTTSTAESVRFDLIVDGVAFGTTIYVPATSGQVATLQTALNTKYGSGSVLIANPSGKTVTIELAGANANTTKTVAVSSTQHYYEGPGWLTLSGSYYTFSVTQAATTPPPEEEEEEPTAATEATLLAIVDELETLTATLTAQATEQQRQTFLLQAVAQTMGLICGGLLWRTIILAKNQTRFW